MLFTTTCQMMRTLKTKGKKIYWRFDCHHHRRRRRADEMSSATSAFSPLSGGYLLIVLSEPHSEQHKQILLEHLAKGQFKSFFLLFKFLLFNYICTYLLDYYWTKWTVTFKLYRIINNELIFVKSFTQVSIVATAIINVERERTAAGQLSSCALHSNGFSFRRNVFFFCFLYLFFSGRCLFYVFGCLCTHPLFF